MVEQQHPPVVEDHNCYQFCACFINVDVVPNVVNVYGTNQV